ncbi:MAG: PaaI family thioesterase [Rhodospirillaceae bacterium]|nr:PaaI family thioesterase [Rhodospirillaceae bacterium]
MSTEREHTIRWHDTGAFSTAIRERPGIEVLQDTIDGKLPQAPIAAALGFHLIETEHGRAVFEAEATEYLYNAGGAVHGGYYGVLLDSAFGYAIQSTLEAGTSFTTMEYKINLVRAMTVETGRVRVEGRVIHRGGRTATAEGEIRDAADKLLGHGTTTCLILKLKP